MDRHTLKKLSHPVRIAEPIRVCARCCIEKPTIEFEIIRKDCLNSVCDTCSGMDKRVQSNKLFYSSNRTCVKCNTDKSPDQFYTGHRSQCKACFIKQCRVNAVKLGKKHQAEKFINWVRANPEKHRATQARRRARKNAALVVTLTAEEWLSKLAEYDHRCAYCFGEFEILEKDHVIPLSKGGNHSIDNIVPACRTCNAIKHNRHVSVMGL